MAARQAVRLSKATGTITEEVIYPVGMPPHADEPSRTADGPAGPRAANRSRPTTWPRPGRWWPTGSKSLPWEGLKLSHGEPAIPTRVVAP